MTAIVWTSIQLTITVGVIIIVQKKRHSSQQVARWGLGLLAITMMASLIGNEMLSTISAQFAFILLAFACIKELWNRNQIHNE